MDETCAQEQKKCKPKRDIFRFTGSKPTAVNMEHVTHMSTDGNKITFNFYTTSLSVDMDDEQAASNAFEQLLGVWASDVKD